MTSLKQMMYWKSPFFVKNWMASWNARKLDRERYGPDYDRIVKEIAERDTWTSEQFSEYQCQQLRSLIKLVSTRVPYYRKMFSQERIDPRSIESPEDLQKLPILEKEIVRSDPTSFVDETLDKRRIVIGYTSGTTGTPLVLYRDVWLTSAAFAYLDARWRAVAGMCRRANLSVNMGTRPIVSPGRRKPPFWVYNKRWKELYMSCHFLAPDYLKCYVDEIRRFKADFIVNVPSAINAVASYILNNALEPISFKACFTTSETLFDYQREAIRKAFRCRTYDQYGCCEMAVFAAECEHGSMHLSPEFGIVEVVDEKDQPVECGHTGQLICTSLINRVQPFIRYRIGDIGALRQGKCSCGSSLPMLDRIEGRSDVFITTKDGRRICSFSPVFNGVHGVVEAQIIQDDYDKFRVRIVPAQDYTETDGNVVVENMTQLVGEATIQTEVVDKIERTSAGKFRAVICNLPTNAS